MRILRPATKWGRVTVWLGILCLLLWTATIFGAKLGGWAVFTTLVFAFCRHRPGLPRGYPPSPVAAAESTDRHLPFHRRHADPAAVAHGRPRRLFICRAVRHLRCHSLTCTRSYSICRQPMIPWPRSYSLWRVRANSTKKSPESSPGPPTSDSLAGPLLCGGAERDLSSPPEESCCKRRRSRFLVLSAATSLALSSIKMPCICARSGFNGDGDRRIALISDIPITPNLLIPTAARLGTVTLYSSRSKRRHSLPQPADSRAPVTAGQVPPRSHWFDITLDFPTLFDVVDWQNGEKARPRAHRCCHPALHALRDLVRHPGRQLSACFATSCSRSRFSSASLSSLLSTSAFASRAA